MYGQDGECSRNLSGLEFTSPDGETMVMLKG